MQFDKKNLGECTQRPVEGCSIVRNLDQEVIDIFEQIFYSAIVRVTLVICEFVGIIGCSEHLVVSTSAHFRATCAPVGPLMMLIRGTPGYSVAGKYDREAWALT